MSYGLHCTQDMVRFASSADIGYIRILGELKRWTRRLPQACADPCEYITRPEPQARSGGTEDSARLGLYSDTNAARAIRADPSPIRHTNSRGQHQ